MLLVDLLSTKKERREETHKEGTRTARMHYARHLPNVMLWVHTNQTNQQTTKATTNQTTKQPNKQTKTTYLMGKRSLHTAVAIVVQHKQTNKQTKKQRQKERKTHTIHCLFVCLFACIM